MRNLNDDEVPFRMPEGWYDPPEEDLPCPRCKYADAVVAACDAITDTLGKFGVIHSAAIDLTESSGGMRFLELCGTEAEAACLRDGGKLCGEHARLAQEGGLEDDQG